MKALAWPVALLAMTAGAPASLGWVGESPGSHHEVLALLAAQRLPSAERDFILAHQEAFARGAWEPDGTVHTFFHAYEPSDGGGGGVHQVQWMLYESAMAMRGNATGDEIAYKLGSLTHFTLDLSVPFHTGPDLYDHGWHLPYERAAATFHDEVDLVAGHEPRELADPRAEAVALAEFSAARSPALLASLDEAQLPWTPEARAITGEVASRGLDVTADALHTAFVWADAGRPAPERPTGNPLPHDAEDVGLGRGDIRMWLPWEGALLLGMAIMAAIWGAAEVVRRGARRSDRSRSTRSSRRAP